VSASVAGGDLRLSPLLRATLAMPLLYVFFRSLPGHWSWVFPSEQATDFYAVTGLLFFIPIAVWCVALVLLALGSCSRIAWGAVGVGGGLVAVYGLLVVLRVERSLNADLAFGLYAALLGASQLVGRRDRTGSRGSEPRA
jgi:hypothetical protein